MTWRIAKASSIGSSHLKAGSQCQDAHQAEILSDGEGREALVCVVSDGAGSAERSAEGSTLACDAARKAASAWWQSKPITLPTAQELTDWVFAISASITELAEQQKQHPRQFACTLLMTIVCEFGAIYLQVGDGAIVIRRHDSYQPVFWDNSGDALNLTHFITDEEWWRHLSTVTTDDCPREVALLTDGLQLLVLDFASRSAHEPFFRQMFSQIHSCPDDKASLLSSSLDSYLGSPAVNSKTDDDKTLVLAARIG